MAFDIYMRESEHMVVAHPHGILDAAMAAKVVDFIEIKEATSESGFHRFLDLTHLDGIQISTYDILRLASRRRDFNPNEVHVKSAFYATDPLAFGIARMYEQMLNSPRIEVRVWSDLQAAAKWLGVHPDSLTLD